MSYWVFGKLVQVAQDGKRYAMFGGIRCYGQWSEKYFNLTFMLCI